MLSCSIRESYQNQNKGILSVLENTPTLLLTTNRVTTQLVTIDLYHLPIVVDWAQSTN